jgi:hypothetical protein
MLTVFLYKADLLCRQCGQYHRDYLAFRNLAPVDPDDESSYDSDEFPKGPYPNGGGEADTPQHCGDCGTFLKNPLTDDGRAYVQEEQDLVVGHTALSSGSQ